VNPARRRHRQTLPTPPAARVAVPAAMRRPAPPDNRVVITRDLLRYAFQVHCADEHAGQLGRGCRTCKRYSLGIALAAATEQDKRAHADAFELPTSAANAYADTMRPHIGGLAHTRTEDPGGYDGTTLIDPNPRARWIPGIGRVIEPPITGPPATMNACRGTTTDPAPASTGATTAPPATHTSPPSKPPEPASAPNPSASNAPA
jgi:hypothetical protein